MYNLKYKNTHKKNIYIYKFYIYIYLYFVDVSNNTKQISDTTKSINRLPIDVVNVASSFDRTSTPDRFGKFYMYKMCFVC